MLLNVLESLRDFTAYGAEGHGKLQAKKGIRFLRFPPVLNLQLKRLHFDLERVDMVKLKILLLMEPRDIFIDSAVWFRRNLHNLVVLE